MQRTGKTHVMRGCDYCDASGIIFYSLRAQLERLDPSIPTILSPSQMIGLVRSWDEVATDRSSGTQAFEGGRAAEQRLAQLDEAVREIAHGAPKPPKRKESRPEIHLIRATAS